MSNEHHDPYMEREKWPEPSRCPDCGAVFVGGRWTWRSAPDPANEVACPACRRIADAYPAGIIEIRGTFFDEHREEILNLIHNTEATEKETRPLERLMDIELGEDAEDATVVTTTGIHLARAIAHKLERRFHRQARIRYPEEQNMIHVDWETD